jgi:hypothetical protein
MTTTGDIVWRETRCSQRCYLFDQWFRPLHGYWYRPLVYTGGMDVGPDIGALGPSIENYGQPPDLTFPLQIYLYMTIKTAA